MLLDSTSAQTEGFTSCGAGIVTNEDNVDNPWTIRNLDNGRRLKGKYISKDTAEWGLHDYFGEKAVVVDYDEDERILYYELLSQAR